MLLQIELLLALTIFLVIPVCVLVFRLPLLPSVGLGFLITLAAVIAVWQMDGEVVMISLANAAVTVLEITFILTGALLLVENSNHLKTFKVWKRELGKFFGDRTALTIVFGFFVSSLLEGIAGFGTPVAIVAPILVGLGYSPLKALIRVSTR